RGPGGRTTPRGSPPGPANWSRHLRPPGAVTGSLSRMRRGPMSSTPDPRLPTGPPATPTQLLAAGRHELQVAVRPGSDPAQPPLLLCNGIGARLELLQPFVDQVDPAITVIRFDVPGVGRSPLPRGFYTF